MAYVTVTTPSTNTIRNHTQNDSGAKKYRPYNTPSVLATDGSGAPGIILGAADKFFSINFKTPQLAAPGGMLTVTINYDTITGTGTLKEWERGGVWDGLQRKITHLKAGTNVATTTDIDNQFGYVQPV